jgi:hypothetical protein
MQEGALHLRHGLDHQQTLEKVLQNMDTERLKYKTSTPKYDA